MKKFKDFFHLNGKYEFDVGDLTALIYVVSVIGVFCGADMTIMFFIGSAIATAFCWTAHRINLVVLNLALFAMNAYHLGCMIWG